jgi:Phosphotyrosyl phosphate activator (PTPA) protein
MIKCNRCVKRWISRGSGLTTADIAYVGLSPLQAAPRFQEQVLRVGPSEAITEVSGYFCESWGNRARIDYGSGMELNFLCWLCVFIFILFRVAV